MYYKLGQVLQIRAIITNWGIALLSSNIFIGISSACKRVHQKILLKGLCYFRVYEMKICSCLRKLSELSLYLLKN